MKCQNPFAFRAGQVTFWTTIIYLFIAIPLIYVHETVPPAPSDHSLYRGLNLTEAWLDLQTITTTLHPFNSHQNDVVRDFIIDRSKQILERNKMNYTSEVATDVVTWSRNDELRTTAPSSRVTVFDDKVANFTRVYRSGAKSHSGTYFEGNNYYVYIRGTEDAEGDWWRTESEYKKIHSKGGVLVNCHIDSVSTGYGATDDGMGCVTLLQLLSYFTSEGRQPKNGIVLLFNNAEEDGLFGALAFGSSPLWQFTHTFVNLEGAGGGGRAMLFRATDLEIAKTYSKSPHPFGSVATANAFERGVIKSGTDYSVFYDILGLRGMDIAFYEPRARYHTDEDDTRHASVDSIWHMLSAALASTEKLSQTTSTVFNGERPDGSTGKVQNGSPTRGVWFDLFGNTWATFALRGLFAWSLTLLVAAPLVLCIVTYLLIRKDKYYFFAGDIPIHSELNDDPVRLGGWKGFFRFPVALIFAGALTLASVLLVGKANPLIIYSSAYAVWAMTVSLFYFAFWVIMRGSNFIRPSALHRGFAIVWLFMLGCVVQVFAAVAEDRSHIAALYSSAFLQSAVFISLFISLLEQFSLPSKHEFAHQLHDEHVARDTAGGHPSAADATPVTVPDAPAPEEPAPDAAPAEDGAESPGPDGEATEETPLIAGDQPTFASTYRQSVSASPSGRPQPYGQEQTWSGSLPQWTWLLQFLLMLPVPLILIGNLGLVTTSALHMTGTDGSSLLAPLLSIGVISILILIPITPFVHRVTHHLPMFLLLVFVLTFIYNLAAFPFSVNHRFKLYFQEIVDLDKGTNMVYLTGLEDHVRSVISAIPAATGQKIECKYNDVWGLPTCAYDASTLPPDLVDGKTVDQLLTVTVPEKIDGSFASIIVDALDTRMCTVTTSQPIFGFTVEGGSPRDPRFGSLPNDGFSSFQLWRRSWDVPWNATLQLTRNSKVISDGTEADAAGDLDVTVSCSYSDVNQPNTIPAFHELKQYMPSWSTVSKRTVGLVEVKKTYTIKA